MDMKKPLYSYINYYKGITFPIWTEIFAGFINSGTSVSVLFIAIYLTNQLDITAIQTGWALASFGLGAMLGGLIGGWLCDKFPPKYITISTMILNGIALVIFPYAHTFYSIICIMTWLGITNNAFSPANRTALMSMAPSGSQHRISSIRYMMMNIGAGLYVFIDGRIAMIEYKYLFLFNSATIIITAAVLILAHRKHPKTDHLVAEKSPKDTRILPKIHMKNLFVAYYCSLLFIALIFSQARITYPLYLYSHYHLSERLFSNLFIINTIMIAILQIPLLNFSRSFNSLLTSSIGALLFGLGMGLLFLSSNYNIAILLCMMWTLGEILYFSTMQIIIFNHAHPNRKGRHMGIYQFIIACASMVGPLTGSVLYNYDNNLIWYCCLALGVFTFILHQRIAYTLKQKNTVENLCTTNTNTC